MRRARSSEFVAMISGVVLSSVLLSGERRGAAAGTPADALVDKVLACYAAEGGISTPEDRASVLAFADELVAALGLPACDGGAECSGAIAALSCADLTRDLTPDLVALAGPVEPWARAFGDAVVARATACAATEDAGVAAAAEASVVDYGAFGAAVGATLSSLVAAESCSVEVSAQTTCVSALAALPCERLANTLGLSPGDAGGASVLDLCPGFVRCSADAVKIEAP